MADQSNTAPIGEVPARPSITAPFRHRIFAAIWISSLISNFGGLIQSVGASWLMLTMTHRPDLVALVPASAMAPMMLFSLAAGAIADGGDNRRVMILAQTEMLLVSVALAVAAFQGWLTPWSLLTFTFLLGCGNALNAPAWQASIGEQVPREDLHSAVMLNGLSFNVARSIGPAIGGAIVAAANVATAFVVNAISYIGLIVVLIRWRPHPRERLFPSERIGTAMISGLRYVAMSPSILTILLRVLVFSLAGSAIWALMPVIASRGVGGGPLSYGLLLGAFGVGAVGGALLSARLRHQLGNEVMVRCATLAYAAATGAVALVSNLPLAMFVLLFAGGGWVLALSTFSASVQISAPRWVVARAMAIYQTLMFAGLALGAWGWGSLAHAHGLRAALLGSGAAGLAATLIGMRLRLGDSTRINLDPHRGIGEPVVGIDIEPRSGPVVTAIDYRIDPARAADFVAAMAERRRIRVRDGARGWMLLQDVADPSHWTERFYSPTWLDYLRTRNRLTVADIEVTERVRELTIELPVARHMLERPAGSMPNLFRLLRGEPASTTVVDISNPPIASEPR
jgi:MFS family permease